MKTFNQFKEEVDKKTFLVHALSKKLSEDLQTDDMNKVITDLDK